MEDIPVFLKTEPLSLDIRLWDAKTSIIWTTIYLLSGTDLLLDSSIGSRTAAFMQPYTDAPDTCGEIYLPRTLWSTDYHKAHQNKLQAGFTPLASAL